MNLFEDDKLLGKTVTCTLKNNRTVMGTVIDYNSKSVFIDGLYGDGVIVSVDYIGALIINGGLDG